MNTPIDLPFTPEEVATGGPFKNPGLNKVLREHELEKRIAALEEMVIKIGGRLELLAVKHDERIAMLEARWMREFGEK